MTEKSTTAAGCNERFAEYYRRLQFPCQIVDGSLWLESNRMIFPLGPASVSHVVPESTAKELLSRVPRAVLVRFTDGFDAAGTSGAWYAVICRKFLELSQCNSQNRKQIKRGLERCTVEKVDAEHIARFGYDLHVAANMRYAKSIGAGPMDAERFRERILAAKDFEDIIDFWAVYHEGVMVGSSRTLLFGSVEAEYSSVTYHPDFLTKCYPSHAMIYTMNEHYLQKRSFQYVNDGFRNVWHPTEFQQFLMRRFPFERAYTNLHVCYKPVVSLVMALPKPVKSLLARLNSKFAALCKLDEARTRP